MSSEPPYILGIIPARAGSKRVPEKNFRPFAGSTLTEIAVQQALQSNILTHIALSTDSPNMEYFSKKYPELICIQRPSALSDDTSPAIDYVRHALGVLEKNGLAFQAVAIVQPSSPLRKTADIDATIELLLQNPEADSAVSIVQLEQMAHPLKLKTLEDNELKPFLEDEAGRFAAHELPKVYVRNGAVYATWRRDLESRPDVIGQRSLAYLMPPERSVDINSWLEFEFAAFMYEQKNRG